MLELKGLSYQVEDNGAQTDILRGIDLTIDNNKFVVITGPNGGGKTTLAKVIMGLVQPTSSPSIHIFPHPVPKRYNAKKDRNPHKRVPAL